MIGFKEYYTAEEALQFYANREFYTVIDGKTAITENGAVAGAGLKSLSLDYCEMKGDVAHFEVKEENKKLRDMLGDYKSLYEFTHANFERVIKERDDCTERSRAKTDRIEQLEQEVAELRRDAERQPIETTPKRFNQWTLR